MHQASGLPESVEITTTTKPKRDDDARAIVKLIEEHNTQRAEEENDLRKRRERMEQSAKERRRQRRSRVRSDSKKRRYSRSPAHYRRRQTRNRHRQRSSSRHRHTPRHQRSRRRRSRSRGKSRSHSSSSNSIQYGGYIPRRRTVPSGFGDASKGQALANSTTDIGRMQQGFSPLPCPTRQVYVGNLVPGLVSDLALRQLFNSALGAAFPNTTRPGTEPVVSVSMHSDGRYAFVELRSPEMATSALQLSGQVQLFGQSITVGRPSGYVDPSKAAAAAQAAAVALAAFNKGEVSAQQTFGAASFRPTQGLGVTQPSGTMTSHASAFLSIEGLIDLNMLGNEQAYGEIVKLLRNECVKYGTVIQMKIPRPADPNLARVLFNTGFYGKAFVQFADALTASRAKEGLMSMATGDKNLAINCVSQEVFAAIL